MESELAESAQQVIYDSLGWPDPARGVRCGHLTPRGPGLADERLDLQARERLAFEQDDDAEAFARGAFDVLPAAPSREASPLRQLAGDCWEWTLSHYEPYPGYRPFAGALMEYNGKFMDNQRVLRGGSFATPRRQARAGYRNFWPADTRFQATGVRLLVDG